MHRDPWWVYSTCCLLYNIRTRYAFGFFELMHISPRFAVMLLAMILSIIFTIIDICAVTSSLSDTLPIGINPFWKLAFVFKLLTDSVILDDFKTALDKLSRRNLSKVEEQCPGQWSNLRKVVSGDRNSGGSSYGLALSPNEVRISRGTSEDGEVDGKGIAVTTETRIEHCPPLRREEVLLPQKVLFK